jgi:hypothetical protein
MIDDMRLRKLADKTQSHYLRAVRQFSLFLGHSPDRATARRPAALSTASGGSRHFRHLAQRRDHRI